MVLQITVRSIATVIYRREVDDTAAFGSSIAAGRDGDSIASQPEYKEKSVKDSNTPHIEPSNYTRLFFIYI